MENHTPACLIDFAASTITTEEIEDKLVDQAHREELFSHYLLHKLQKIIHAYVKGDTHYRQNRW